MGWGELANVISKQNDVTFDGSPQACVTIVVEVEDVPGPGLKIVPVKLNPLRNESGKVMSTSTADNGLPVLLVNTKIPPPVLPPPGADRAMG